MIPGTERETGKERLSGKGKYQQGVQSFLSTGRGGGRKQKPEEVSGTYQRARLGKGTSKTAAGPVQRPVTMTGDIKKPITGQPSSFSQQEPTQQSLQRREQIPQLAQSIAARRGIEIPKGVRLQHIEKKEAQAILEKASTLTKEIIEQLQQGC